MRRQSIIRAFLSVTLVATLAGCSIQYNGAWGFADSDEDDREVLAQTQQHHSDKSAE